MQEAFNDKWFALAVVVMALAVVFLLAAADTAGVVPFDTFKAIAEWMWKFFAGAAAGVGLQMVYRSQAAKRGGAVPPLDGGG